MLILPQKKTKLRTYIPYTLCPPRPAAYQENSAGMKTLPPWKEILFIKFLFYTNIVSDVKEKI
jgi:hypothetical protein